MDTTSDNLQHASYLTNVIDVRRIVVKCNQQEVKTKTLIFTFNTPKIPEVLVAGYIRIPVTQYIPNPMR